MIIKLLLSFLLVALVLYTIYQGERLFPWKLPFIAALLIGFLLVWRPDYATLAANHLGVGRGADLLLYFLVIAILVLIINIHNKFYEINKANTELVRKLAILEWQLKQCNKSS